MQDRIVIDPTIHHGQPVIRGTRVPVATLLGSLAGGMDFQDVRDDYGVTDDDIRSAIAYAAELVETEQHHALPSRAG